MKAYDIIVQILLMLGGLGVFLIGMKMMGDGLESASGDKLRRLFNKISNNRFSGMAVGAGVTAVIQSSSATTVMVVGFVNAGLMTLAQAASIIMGANIGTTVTAQILQFSGMGNLAITTWFAALAAVGAFMMMSKKDALKKVGTIMAGLGMIFVGLDVMGGAMKVFAQDPSIAAAFQSISNPFALFAMGLAFTAIIQSSSAVTGILITLVTAGLMTTDSAITAILGINIGTCVTALLSSIGTNTNAKRAAMIHILFNTIGALIFFPIAYFVDIGSMMDPWFNNPATTIAMFHTFFNVVTTFLLIGFLKPLVKLATLMVPEKKQTAEETEVAATQNRFKYIDERILNTPAIALAQVKKEIVFMGTLAKKNLEMSITALTTLNLEKKDKFDRRETHINFLDRNITNYLVKLSSNDIGYRDEVMIGSFYHVVSDLERVGDYAENIFEYAEKLVAEGSGFSESAIDEIKNMYKNVEIVFDNSLLAFENKDLSLLKTVSKYEDIVDDCKYRLGNSHFERLKSGECSPEVGAIYLSLTSNLERIADHMVNISKSVKDYAKAPVEIKATIKK